MSSRIFDKASRHFTAEHEHILKTAKQMVQDEVVDIKYYDIKKFKGIKLKDYVAIYSAINDQADLFTGTEELLPKGWSTKDLQEYKTNLGIEDTVASPRSVAPPHAPPTSPKADATPARRSASPPARRSASPTPPEADTMPPARRSASPSALPAPSSETKRVEASSAPAEVDERKGGEDEVGQLTESVTGSFQAPAVSVRWIDELKKINFTDRKGHTDAKPIPGLEHSLWIIESSEDMDYYPPYIYSEKPSLNWIYSKLLAIDSMDLDKITDVHILGKIVVLVVTEESDNA